MPDTVITGFDRMPPQASAGGHVILARFNVAVGGLVLLNLRLSKATDGTMRVPNETGSGGANKRPRGIVIKDESLRAEILALAVARLAETPPLAPVAPFDPKRHRAPRRAP